MNHHLVIGTDIGGSHITCMGVDVAKKTLLHDYTSRMAVDSQGSADTILNSWTQALAEVIQRIPSKMPGGIGFAMPGPFDYPTGLALFKGVKKYDSLYNVNVKDELRKRLHLDESIPVRFLNDATCFAIGETWMGVASGFSRTVAITLGTGFGSAFLDEGIPVESGDEVPRYGCVYHLPFGSSIADDHFSSRWFKQEFREHVSEEPIGVKEMAELAPSEPKVMAIFTEFGQNLGNFLAPWLNRFSAECLVIGGNIAKGYNLFEKPFRIALQSHGCETQIYLSALGECAAIAGSARLTDDSFYSRLPYISNK